MTKPALERATIYYQFYSHGATYVASSTHHVCPNRAPRKLWIRQDGERIRFSIMMSCAGVAGWLILYLTLCLAVLCSIDHQGFHNVANLSGNPYNAIASETKRKAVNQNAASPPLVTTFPRRTQCSRIRTLASINQNRKKTLDFLFFFRFVLWS